MSYPISDLNGLDEDMAAELRAIGIRTTEKLLNAAKDPKGRKKLAEKTGFDEKLILRWANMADRMRIKGLGKAHAELLQAAGVDTVKELKYRNPARLARAMKEANGRRKLVRLMPSEKAVVRWIEQAKKLPIPTA
jgi:predicted flap endonuclease-1-like 5' DNA nuclease